MLCNPPAQDGVNLSGRLDEKIRKLDEQLVKHKDTIKRARPGPAQEAAKRRALGVRLLTLLKAASPKLSLHCRLCHHATGPHICLCAQVLKQKKMLEAQRDQLYNQQYNMEQTSFALESMKDSVAQVKAMKNANKELKQAFNSKELNITSIDKLHDDMADMMVRLSLLPLATYLMSGVHVQGSEDYT